MRVEEFKMERPNLVEIGQQVAIIEKNTVAFYYYIIVPAVAMSGNFPFGKRVKSTSGKVVNIRENEKGTFVDVEFEA